MKHINEDDEIRILGGSDWKSPDKPKPSAKKHRLFIYAAVIVIICAAAGWGIYKLTDHYYGFEYPLSRGQEEVISALEKDAAKADSTGVSFSKDTYLGVDLKLYKISGLKAELRDSFPSLDNTDVYMVTRSSDYRIDGNKNKIIGDYVIDGRLISKSNWRAGYFVVSGDNVEIGVGRRPDMRSYVMDNKGSMFRQFALVSAGVKCVSQYVLKGKVTRCAYLRMQNGDMYFVETVNPETLYGFADALIEFGAVDAVYVTGGLQEDLFYRDCQGLRHGCYVDDKAHQMVVWTRK